MAYSSTPVVTWNRSTPRDGLLFNQEFAQIYSNIEDYISGNGGSAPTLTLQQVATGNVTIAGTKTFSGAVILPQTTTPSQTAEGSIVWDTDNDLLTVGDGSSRKVMVDTSQDQTIAGTKTFSSKITGDISGDCDGNAGGHAHAIVDTSASAFVLKVKQIDIGIWNMDTTATKTVTHGMTASKIKFWNVVIYTDDAQESLDEGTTIESSGGGGSTKGAENFVLMRTAGGIFDNTYYDNSTLNRGFIYIWYID